MLDDASDVAGPSATGRPAPDTRTADRPVREPMYDDTAKQLELLKRCQADARNNSARQARDRADLLNLNMEKGGEDHQWTVWDPSANTYVPRPTDGDAGLPQWFFRATSNFLSNKIDGVTAIQNQSQPSHNWYPTKSDDQSEAAAKIAEMADPVLLDEIDYPHALRPRLNKLVALTNVAGLVLTYDTDPKHGMEALPLLLCGDPNCRQVVNPMDAPNPDDPCPGCGATDTLDFAADPRDPSGMTPLSIDKPKGRIDAELLSSFEISMPRSAAMALEDRMPWITSHQRWATEAVLSRWADNDKLHEALGHGQTGSNTRGEQAFADQVRNLSAPVVPDQAQGAGASSASTGPVIWRLWHDPIDDEDFCFPQGLFLTVLEGHEIVLDAGPLPFTDSDGRPFKNILLRQYAPSPGSAWGKPPADDLVPLQKQLNLAQSLAFLILMHHASPRTFIPSTVTLHDQLTGVPGKDVGYRSIVPGDKPFVEPGQSFPEGLKWFLEFIISTFDTVSKLNAVLMGQRPEGDPTLGEIEILQERGFAAFQEPLEQLVAFERRLSLKLLWIARESAWAPRFRRMVNPDNGDWELKQFTGADLEGHVTLDIELASAWPKSPLLANLRLAKAIELQIVDPHDPEVQAQYLKMNDLQDFKQSNDVDSEQIARQLAIWREATSPQQIEQPQLWWRLDLHLFRKSQFLKSEAFETLRADPQKAPVAQAMLQHVQMLHQMLQPPATDAAPPAPGKPGEKGVLQQALASGKLKPPAKPGSKGTLPRAIAAGAVRPARPKAKAPAGKRGLAAPTTLGTPGTTTAANPPGAQA